jgi:hypothetical protein
LKKSNDKYIIATNGYTASLKTTITKKLAEKFKINRIEARSFGKIINENDKNNRYKLMIQSAEKILNSENSIILDGAFGKKGQREFIYDLAKKNSAKIIFIRCSCDDKKERLRRLKSKDKSIESLCVKEWLNQSYDEVYQKEIDNHNLVLIDIDTYFFKIKSLNNFNDFESKVFKELNTIVNELDLENKEIYIKIESSSFLKHNPIVVKNRELIYSKQKEEHIISLTDFQFDELIKLLDNLNLKNLKEGKYSERVYDGVTENIIISYKGEKKVFECYSKHPSKEFGKLIGFIRGIVFDFFNPYIKLNKSTSDKLMDEMIDALEYSWNFKYSKEEAVENKRCFNKILMMYPGDKIYRRIGDEVSFGMIHLGRFSLLKDYFKKNRSSLKERYGEFERNNEDEFLEFKFNDIDLFVRFCKKYPDDEEFQEILFIILNEFDRKSVDEIKEEPKVSFV